MEYKIIITKNRQHYKLLKTYKTKINAIEFFNNIIKENAKVKFEKKYVRYKPCTYHIELLSPKKYFDVIEFEKDKLGRNIKVPDRNGLFIWKLKDWKEPEFFSIYGLDGRFDYNFLYELLKKTKNIIGMSTIQNTLILDIDGKPLIIILKNVEDAIRLYKVVLSENFSHVLPFGKMSKKNRKEFYKKAEDLGIPIRMFYTKSTRW